MLTLEKNAKREYLLIKSLEIVFIGLLIILSIIGINSLIKPHLITLTYITAPYFPLVELLIGLTVLICGILFWRWYRIPTILQEALTYYKEAGYIIKRSLFHSMKIQKLPNISFKIKLHLYNRSSAESCLFKLESMPLPHCARFKSQFLQIGERFFLNSDLKTQKFSTTCELGELHLRSHLLSLAISEAL